MYGGKSDLSELLSSLEKKNLETTLICDEKIKKILSSIISIFENLETHSKNLQKQDDLSDISDELVFELIDELKDLISKNKEEFSNLKIKFEQEKEKNQKRKEKKQKIKKKLSNFLQLNEIQSIKKCWKILKEKHICDYPTPKSEELLEQLRTIHKRVLGTAQIPEVEVQPHQILQSTFSCLDKIQDKIERSEQKSKENCKRAEIFKKALQDIDQEFHPQLYPPMESELLEKAKNYTKVLHDLNLANMIIKAKTLL